MTRSGKRVWKRLLRPSWLPLFAILLGALGWEFSLLDRTLSEAPLATFDMTCQSSSGISQEGNHCRLKVQNISNQLFREVDINVFPPEGVEAEFFRVDSVDPGISPESVMENPEAFPDLLHAKIVAFQPGSIFDIRFDTFQITDPLVRISSEKTPIVSRPTDLTTLISSKRTTFHLVLLIILFVLLLTFIVLVLSGFGGNGAEQSNDDHSAERS